MFRIHEMVTTSRSDSQGKLKLFSAFQMLQDCSELWLDSAKVYRDYLKENGLAQLLASRQVEIIRVPEYKEELTVETSVFDCQPLFGFRNTFIYDAAGNPCYKTWSLGVFVELASGKMKKLPAEVMNATVMDSKLDMNYGERKIAVPDGEFQTFSPVAVERNDIDYNGHMNNAHYVRLAMECLPEDFATKTVRVEYKIPARRGELLVPEMLLVENRAYIKLMKGNVAAAVLEFG